MYALSACIFITSSEHGVKIRLNKTRIFYKVYCSLMDVFPPMEIIGCIFTPEYLINVTYFSLVFCPLMCNCIGWLFAVCRVSSWYT